MFAPPRIRLGEPESIEASTLAGFGHGDGFADGLHAELQNADFEGHGHKIVPRGTIVKVILYGLVQECSKPLINCQTARFRGVGTPSFFPHSTIAPFIKSTSVCRWASISCSILALCLPGALAAFITTCLGSLCNSMPRALATARPSSMSALNSSPVGGKNDAAP